MKIRRRLFHCGIPTIGLFSLLLISPMTFSSLSMGETKANADENLPLWWMDTLKRAESGGYDLVTLNGMQTLTQSGKDFVLLDVRPDYEYREGHLSGAKHLEFHLGHRSMLEPERAESLKALLGEDRDRLLVTYCRNFR